MLIPGFGSGYGMPTASVRTYTVLPNETPQSTSMTTIPAAATFQLRQRDHLDYTVDFRAFLAAIGEGIKLVSAAFTVVSSTTVTGTSTGAPTIDGQAFSEDGVATLVLAAHATAAVGDIYTLDITAVTDVTPVATGATVPGRTIVRRLAIVVVAG